MNPPLHILTIAQMQAADAATIASGTPGITLMERAGKALIPACHATKLDAGRIVIITGSGNNGGDGFTLARLLKQKQIQVTVVPTVPLDALQGDAAAQAQLARESGVKIRPALSEADLPNLRAWLNRAVLIVDAIFGVGLSRPIQGWQAQVIRAINQCDRPVLAVDIPSGIHGDTGEVLGEAVQATATLPIAAYKWGHWLRQGVQHCGKLAKPASIGITSQTMTDAQAQHPGIAASGQRIHQGHIAQAVPEYAPNSHKKQRGHVWVFGGAMGYTGAPQLAASGAQACGAGLVSIACPQETYAVIAASALEVMVHPQTQAPWQQADALVAGPGWGQTSADILHTLLQSTIPLVLDADGLNLLASHPPLQEQLKQRRTTTVLTPHPGEAAKLLDTDSAAIQRDRVSAVVALAEQYDAWVVLKGAQTLIASPDKHVMLNPYGSANLAVAGTGDVLAGMIAAWLPHHRRQPGIAIAGATALHGLIGEQPDWFRAGQLPALVAKHIARLRQQAGVTPLSS